jgi:Icc-related predicted phosphoesterase
MPHKHKIFIAGNHDVLFEKNSGIAKALVRECPELIYLEDSGVCIDGVNFWGSPVTPTFFNWAFNRDRGSAIRKHWEAIPDDTDVLISHGPPHKICDTVLRDRGFPDEVGCEELAKRVQQLKLKLHLFGHIHFSGGSEKTFGSTIFSNVCLCNEDYRIVNEPKVFII